MINLIPPEGHRIVRREYMLRVGATLAFLFGAVCILLTAALIPTYVLVNAQIQSLEIESEKVSDKEEVFKNAEEEVRLTRDVLTQLKTPTTIPMSIIIQEIQRLAPDSISFKAFQIESKNGVIGQIAVSGSAPTREVLSQLKASLESADIFLTAEIPIADLARDSDLAFAITITLAPAP